MKAPVVALLCVAIVLGLLQLGIYLSSNKEKDSLESDRYEVILELRVKNQQLAKRNEELEKKILKYENSKKNIPLSEWNTTVRCFFFSDYSQICLYEHLCTNGKDLLFLDPSQPSANPIKLKGPEAATEYDPRYHEPHPWPVIEGNYVPTGSSFVDKIYSISSPQLGNKKSVEILPGAIWYSPFDGNPQNLWHSSSQTMLLWEAQLYNETLPENAKLPSMDYVQSPREFILPGWEAEVFEVITQPHTQFLFPQFFNSDFVPSNKDPNLGKHNLTIPIRPPGKPSIGNDNLLCSEKAVVFSQKPRLFSGIYSAQKFKERIGKRLGFPPQRPRGRFRNNHGISNKVVVDYRGEHVSRNLFNRNEILELLEYYKLTWVDSHAWPQMTNLSVQIEDLWDADALIIVHGAGAMNAMFLPYRASLIEIYPWGYRPPMYDNMADAIGLHYTGLQSYIKGQLVNNPCGGELYSTNYYQQCGNISNLDHGASICGSYAKNACVHVPIRDLEMALIDSYDFIGVNLNARVDQLFSKTREFRENDFHHKNNTFWTSNAWEHGITNPITWAEHLENEKRE